MIIPLQARQVAYQDKRLAPACLKLQSLITALNKRYLSDGLTNRINEHIIPINLFSGSDRGLITLISKKHSSIVQLVEKELGLVPRKHYCNQWMALGMCVFGLPMGLVFSAFLDNYAFLGIGLPIGIAIGSGVGTRMDKKAESDGRQLDCDA